MKYQVASLSLEKLDIESDQIQMFAVGAATDILGELGRRGNQLVHIAGDLDANLVEHPMVVGDVVLLEAPRNAPLLGVCRTQFAARLAVPGAGILDAGQEVIPGIFR